MEMKAWQVTTVQYVALAHLFHIDDISKIAGQSAFSVTLTKFLRLINRNTRAKAVYCSL